MEYKNEEYVIAIPSYQRAKEIQTKTLKYLNDCGIEDERIVVFVANEEQKNIYITAGVKQGARPFKTPTTSGIEIVVGVLGITNQRNFIMCYFPIDQYVVSMDDDIERLERAIDGKFVPILALDEVFKENHQLMLEENRYIWGIYPVHNIFFIKKPISTGLAFIIGVCHGYVNRRILLDVAFECKEDIQNSILHYLRDGGVLRINTIVAKTKFNAKGGLGIDRTEINKRSAKGLAKTYPNLCSVYQRKNGTHEIRLKTKRLQTK